MSRRPGTTPAAPRSWADNRALLEDWRQAFVSAPQYLVPTALRWIPRLIYVSALVKSECPQRNEVQSFDHCE